MDSERESMSELLRMRLQQQSAIAEFGQLAFASVDARVLMNQATQILTRTLALEFSEVLELLPESQDLVLIAGSGWQDGSIGRLKWAAGKSSQAGYTLLANEAVIVDGQHEETRFGVSQFLRDHGVVSGITVPIAGRKKPFGVLGAHSATRQSFAPEDVCFVQSIASILAQAIACREAEEALDENERKYRGLAEALLEVLFKNDVDAAAERRQMESDLRKLSYAVDQSPVSVVITDRTGSIEYVNSKFADLTGYSREEIKGENPRILKSGNMAPETYAQLWKTITSGDEWIGDLQNRKKNGDLYWEHASISPIKDVNGRISHFVAIKEDITERRNLEQQFLQAQKMEAIGRLAGGVAHDFNNILTVILGCSSMVLKKIDEKDPCRAEIEQISHAGERAATLTSQLLAFSRKQIHSPVALNVNTLIADDEMMLRRLIGEDIEIILRLDPDANRIFADPAQIEQVIMNLAVNARDAMSSGGRLIIETSNVILDEAYLRDHLGAKAGPHLLLAISDSGSGMTREVMSHLFEPFFTTKELGRGTGLGLSTVYGIVKQNGGTIWAYSEPGNGSAFKIYLPLVAKQTVPEALVLKGVPGESGNETILVVEDDSYLRELACRILAENGYDVLQAKDADDAEAICLAHHDPIHLLFADVVLPGASGRELARRLTLFRPEMKVLYTSGYTDEAIVRHGILEPGIAFIPKPFGPDQLMRAVREVLEFRG